MFDTETGVSTLILKEIPYKQVAYVKVQSVQPDGLGEHLRECVSFCRMCGAERVLASGHEGLEQWPVFCSVTTMALGLPATMEYGANLFPVTEATVGQWRSIYNERMGPVDNAATMTARDEREILAGGAYFVHEDGELLGIGWMKGSELLCIASVKPGAGERVTKTLLTLADSDRVTLDVASTNRRAIRLYERMGFVPVAQKAKWYQIL
jgi:GNAT superfamily N-acetyltransferase